MSYKNLLFKTYIFKRSTEKPLIEGFPPLSPEAQKEVLSDPERYKKDENIRQQIKELKDNIDFGDPTHEFETDFLISDLYHQMNSPHAQRAAEAYRAQALSTKAQYIASQEFPDYLPYKIRNNPNPPKDHISLIVSMYNKDEHFSQAFAPDRTKEVMVTFDNSLSQYTITEIKVAQSHPRSKEEKNILKSLPEIQHPMISSVKDDLPEFQHNKVIELWDKTVNVSPQERFIIIQIIADIYMDNGNTTVAQTLISREARRYARQLLRQRYGDISPNINSIYFYVDKWIVEFSTFDIGHQEHYENNLLISRDGDYEFKNLGYNSKNENDEIS